MLDFSSVFLRLSYPTLKYSLVVVFSLGKIEKIILPENQA